MKNILSFVAVLSAFALHADAVSWTVVGGDKSLDGCRAYLVKSIQNWENVAALEASAKSFGGDGAIGTYGYLNSRSGYGFVAQSAIGDGITKESMATANIVLVADKDGKSFKYVTKDMSESVYTEQQGVGVASSTKTEELLKGNSGTFGGHTDPTPEPTSGLLLLLGAAGLALRRRVK